MKASKDYNGQPMIEVQGTSLVIVTVVLLTAKSHCGLRKGKGERTLIMKWLPWWRERERE